MKREHKPFGSDPFSTDLQMDFTLLHSKNAVPRCPPKSRLNRMHVRRTRSFSQKRCPPIQMYSVQYSTVPPLRRCMYSVSPIGGTEQLTARFAGVQRQDRTVLHTVVGCNSMRVCLCQPTGGQGAEDCGCDYVRRRYCWVGVGNAGIEIVGNEWLRAPVVPILIS